MTDDLIDRLQNPHFDDLQWPKGLFAECADRIETLEAALRKGQYMRQKQKQYFKDRTQDNLIGSKQAEQAFDKAACAALEGEKKDG